MRAILFISLLKLIFFLQSCGQEKKCVEVHYLSTPVSNALKDEFIENKFTSVVNSLELSHQEKSEYYFLSKISKEELKLKKSRIDSCFNSLISLDPRKENELCEIKKFLPEILYLFNNNFIDYTLNEYIDEKVLGRISEVFDTLRVIKPVSSFFKREAQILGKYKDYYNTYDIKTFTYAEDDEIKEVVHSFWVKWGIAHLEYLNDKDFLGYQSKLSSLAGEGFMPQLMRQHIIRKKKNRFFNNTSHPSNDSMELEKMFNDFDSIYYNQCDLSKIQFNLYYKELTPDLLDDISLCIKSLNPIDSILATSCLAQYYLYENEIEKAVKIINAYDQPRYFKFFYQEQEYGIIKSVDLEVAFQKGEYGRFKRILINLEENPEINYYENRSATFIAEFIFRKYYKHFPNKNDDEIYDMYEKEFADFVSSHCIYE